MNVIKKRKMTVKSYIRDPQVYKGHLKQIKARNDCKILYQLL